MLKLQINGFHKVVDEDLARYVTKKIGKMDKYLPKNARDSAHAEVFLKETTSTKRKNCTCEVVIHLPKVNIAISETTINIYAAVDIVEEKLKNQLVKYKQKHSRKSISNKLLRPFRRKILTE